ncbi:MAG: class I tRNA ligase family protein, partial [Desulfamplus sp.]|nr:class I tRNA ligase family protein [Desulfamplus sp.]
INNEKMSKSLGNFIMIKDMLAKYHSEVIRLFLLSKHYRSPIDYNENSMDEVISSLDKIYAFMDRAYKAGISFLNYSHDVSSTEASSTFSEASSTFSETSSTFSETWTTFKNDMDDDFNTAKAMATVFDTVKKGNKFLDKCGESVSSRGESISEPSESISEPGKSISEENMKILETMCSDLRKMGSILGILSQTPEAYFKAKKEAGLADGVIDSKMVDQLVMERTEARKSKNFARADEIRKQLDEMKIILEDGSNGTTWKFSQ